jgi:hypothetical protein
VNKIFTHISQQESLSDPLFALDQIIAGIDLYTQTLESDNQMTAGDERDELLGQEGLKTRQFNSKSCFKR